MLRAACARPDAPELRALEQAAAAFYHAQKKKRRRARARADASHDDALRAAVDAARATGASSAPTAGAAASGRYRRARSCYACAQPYASVHGYYAALCPACAAGHLAHRAARADLAGRRALITGGRTKAGYALALRMLRDGAAVVVTTRYPTDARRRYGAEPDAADWSHRLRVVGLDLLELPRVLAWTDAWIARGEPLDVLVNHAAHSVPYAPSLAAALRRRERPALPAGREALIGSGALDEGGPVDDLARGPALDGGEVATVPAEHDARGARAWRQRIDEVDPAQALEALLVNAVAPFVLTSRLLPALLASPHAARFVVNVTAIEGRFVERAKRPYHPHLNMAKAALNMLTRTSAGELAARGVYVNSVDPGWFSDPAAAGDDDGDDAPRTMATPLDPVDAAARIYDPIVQGLAGRPVWGCLLKNYAPSPW